VHVSVFVSVSVFVPMCVSVCVPNTKAPDVEAIIP
jgi:hypothetical protein